MFAKWGNMGKLVFTGRIASDINRSKATEGAILEALRRYISGEWGDLPPEDKEIDDRAIATGDDRILARYKAPEEDIYIITEWDRSYTTVLYISEY